MFIEKVSNGYVLTNDDGAKFVFNEFKQVAEHLGEVLPNLGISLYVRQELGALNLWEVIKCVKQGNQFEAVKSLRNLYSPKLGLAEAIHIVETMMQLYTE